MSRLENRIPPPLVGLVFALAMWAFAYLLPAASVRFPGREPVAALFLALARGNDLETHWLNAMAEREKIAIHKPILSA